MREGQWLSEQARTAVRDCIRQIEGSTGAEVVVTVAVRSGHYRHADYLFGAFVSLVALLVYLLHPEPIADDVAALVIVACFPIGAFFCATVSPLRRLLVARRILNAAVATTARARFVDQGISRTRERVGVLVYISLFERRVEVVADIGVPVASLAEPWMTALRGLQTAVMRAPDPTPFLAALRKLGELLARAVPRATNDKNELSDEVAAG